MDDLTPRSYIIIVYPTVVYKQELSARGLRRGQFLLPGFTEIAKCADNLIKKIINSTTGIPLKNNGLYVCRNQINPWKNWFFNNTGFIILIITL